MRLAYLSAALCCSLALVSNAGVAQDSKKPDKPKSAKQSSRREQPMVPTLPPPTAEWPVFPEPDATKSKTEAADPPATQAEPPAPQADPSTTQTEPSAAQTNTAPDMATPTQPAATEAVVVPVPEKTPAQMEPHKRPVPAGYDAAAELYKQKKFAQAGKAFEAIIQKGAANVDTHLSLAYCYLLQRLYSKAVKEFEWVAKYGKNSMSLQNQAGRTAISLRTYMAGVCPAPCLKANDPRWTLRPDGKRWIRVQYSSKTAHLISEYHVGEYVANENGVPVLKGTCPVCGGTGQIAKLKDGDPPPRL